MSDDATDPSASPIPSHRTRVTLAWPSPYLRARQTTSHEVWSQKVPLGTPVLYWPVALYDECYLTTTRSESWFLGPELCVKLDGWSGGISVDHLLILPTWPFDMSAVFDQLRNNSCVACGYHGSVSPETGDGPPIVRGALDAQAKVEARLFRCHQELRELVVDLLGGDEPSEACQIVAHRVESTIAKHLASIETPAPTKGKTI